MLQEKNDDQLLPLKLNEPPVHATETLYLAGFRRKVAAADGACTQMERRIMTASVLVP